MSFPRNLQDTETLASLQHSRMSLTAPCSQKQDHCLPSSHHFWRLILSVTSILLRLEVCGGLVWFGFNDAPRQWRSRKRNWERIMYGLTAKISRWNMWSTVQNPKRIKEKNTAKTVILIRMDKLRNRIWWAGNMSWSTQKWSQIEHLRRLYEGKNLETDVRKVLPWQRRSP